jgi:hypothetical protein
MALQEIIRQSFEACVTGDVGWNVSTQAGDELVARGFWDDCDRILAQLVIIFRTTLGLEDLTVAPPKVVMINTNFSLNSSVNLNRLIQKLKLSSQFRVTFDPDRYSAVKVKFSPRPGQKQVTASIFRTGKIIVTGAQTLDEISGAYEVLNGQIDASLLVKPTPTIETFETILGGRFEDWVDIFKNKNIGT